MCQPFIRNHQFNLIKKQADWLQRTCSTVADRKVLESARASVQMKVTEAFPDLAEPQRQALEKLWTLETPEQFKQYLQSLEPMREAFESVTEQQVKKLFPKVKKLKLPDLASIDDRNVTYLGWTDIASNKQFLVYRLNGQLVGIEGRFTPANKKNTCFLCLKQEEVALFTAVTKTKPAGASPDYYKAIGNYLCTNSEACNRNITDVSTLEKFIRDVIR